jgi:hypothetical protein
MECQVSDDAAISKVRHAIRCLQKVRNDGGWFTPDDQDRYVALLAEEVFLLADFRSRGVPIPAS